MFEKLLDIVEKQFQIIDVTYRWTPDALGATTLSITTLSVITFSTVTLSIRINASRLSALWQIVVMLSVANMLSMAFLIVMPSFIMPNAVLLSVVAPSKMIDKLVN